MRLSDAIATGRVLVAEAKANDIYSCALGMAGYAVGIRRDEFKIKDTVQYSRFTDQWPWLGTASAECPVCSHQRLHQSEIVWHVFDLHVMNQQVFSLEQLIDFIRSIEPADEGDQESLAKTPSQLLQDEEMRLLGTGLSCDGVLAGGER